MTDQNVGMGTDVSLTVRRAGKIVDTRNVIDDIEITPEIITLIKKLMEDNKKEV